MENDQGVIEGTWTQGGRSLALALTRTGQKLEGTLKVPTPRFTIVFRIESDEAKGAVAKMDSPDQGATGIPVDDVILNGNAITMRVKRAMGVYKGTKKDGMIEGLWMQGGVTIPLTLKRTDK